MGPVIGMFLDLAFLFRWRIQTFQAKAVETWEMLWICKHVRTHRTVSQQMQLRAKEAGSLCIWIVLFRWRIQTFQVKAVETWEMLWIRKDVQTHRTVSQQMQLRAKGAGSLCIWMHCLDEGFKHFKQKLWRHERCFGSVKMSKHTGQLANRCSWEPKELVHCVSGCTV